MSSAGALGTMLTGQNGMATLALTALNIVRSILPTPGEVLANAYSGIVAWGPVGAALVPVLGNLAIIYACFIAIKETNAFVLSGSREGLVFLTNADYKGFLVQLSKRIFDVLMRSATGSIQARMNRNAGVRRTVAAAAAASAAPVRAIEAAVDAALAQPGLAPVFQAATATASGTGLSAAAGGGAAGPLPTITEEQAEEAADAATVAGEEAERQSQAAGEGPQGGAAAAAEEENSQAAGFEGMNLPQGNQAERNAFNFNTRTTSTRMGVPVNRSGGVAGPASGALGATPAALAMAAAAPAPVAAPSGRGTKRTLTAAAAAPAPGGGGRGAASKRGKGGKSRKQHGGRRNQKKTRKNRK
jgi:hypothetical protein